MISSRLVTGYLGQQASVIVTFKAFRNQMFLCLDPYLSSYFGSVIYMGIENCSKKSVHNMYIN